MKKPKVFIVVLNYNGGNELRQCLDSVYKLNYSNFEVIVVDNNSSDNSFEKARKRFDRFHFIKNSRNLGFSAGNNVAIKWALEKGAEYVFLLNNDAIVEKSTLTNLIEFAEKEKQVGIVSPIIYNKSESKIWFSGGKINWWKMRTEHWQKAKPKRNKSKKTNDKNDYLQKTEYITGCAMLIKRKVFAEIGLLDEDFFLYYEDADFSLRAKRNGFNLGVVENAKVFHSEKSLENPQKVYWLVLSGILFFRKNALWYWRPYLGAYLFLRKLKNKYNLLKNPNDKVALLIQKAYQDDKR